MHEQDRSLLGSLFRVAKPTALQAFSFQRGSLSGVFCRAPGRLSTDPPRPPALSFAGGCTGGGRPGIAPILKDVQP